jgi:hypothetical protein
VGRCALAAIVHLFARGVPTFDGCPTVPIGHRNSEGRGGPIQAHVQWSSSDMTRLEARPLTTRAPGLLQNLLQKQMFWQLSEVVSRQVWGFGPVVPVGVLLGCLD